MLPASGQCAESVIHTAEEADSVAVRTASASAPCWASYPSEAKTVTERD